MAAKSQAEGNAALGSLACPELEGPVWEKLMPTNAGGVVSFYVAKPMGNPCGFTVIIKQALEHDTTPVVGGKMPSDSDSTDKPDVLDQELQYPGLGQYPRLRLTVDEDGARLVLEQIGITAAVTSESAASDSDSSNSVQTIAMAEGATNAGPDASGRSETYWISLNTQALEVKYGKGYHMVETTLLKFGKEDYDLLSKEERNQIKAMLLGTKPKEVSLYKHGCDKSLWSDAPAGVVEAEKQVYFDRVPLTVNPPARVQDSSLLSMYDLHIAKCTFSADLPESCQVLYRNITGPNIDLDISLPGAKFKLSDAIRSSLNRKEGLLWKTLKGKQEPEDAPLGSKSLHDYLRVTLGSNTGGSPGIPYVLEIWPKGAVSPVHNHGNVCAVIKVLHGEINVHVYNKLHAGPLDPKYEKRGDGAPDEELLTETIKKGDVTWISPNWYQTHKLSNTSDDYCATLQCYKYASDDALQWPYFDYLENDQVGEFEPNSDLDFGFMCRKVLVEYYETLISSD
eukprot:TRINITY_DN2051_c0_g1_i1.p1 TRINITY_DN2051_c0_g1~~TRINITY_DN2051_c0_g1_i1.p1  ORF type:complete len:531 (+),score=84.15 TRINITY_DN2051_c0_g1_i1:64-1593(+)